MGDFPDSGTLRAVLDLATRAPSSHDWQPWRWRVGPGVLDLFADRGGELPRADPERREVLLSCGATLHHAMVALAAMGWSGKVHRLPDPGDPGHLAAVELAPRPAGELDVTLASAITRRRTDRRRYGSWAVPWGDIALMGARAARAGVMLRQMDQWPVPAPPAGSDGSVVMALGTENDDELARLRAGEATSLVLLSATAMGLASCPVSEPLAVPETREALRADVFGAGAHPQAMVRVGWPEFSADPLPPAPRRPLAEVTEGLCGSAPAGRD